MGNEVHRLRDLSSFALELDEHQEELGSFVDLAQSIAQSVTCEINVIDAYNQWTLARTEDDLKVLPREKSICQHTILQDEPHEVIDLQEDERFEEMSYIHGDPWYRYYFGVQLKSSNNQNIGSLCVLDTESKTLTEGEKKQIKLLADLIVDKLEQNREQKRMAAQLHEYRNKFYTFTHDLRSPLNGIIGISEVLVETETNGAEEKLNMIRDCATTISDEMDEVLNAVDQKENQLEQEVVLSKLPKKIDRLYRPQAESKNITLNIQFDLTGDIQLPNYYFGKLTQIVGNLVANGLKFTSSGGTVAVNIENHGSQVLEIEVSDDGSGMSVDQVESFNQQKEVAGTEGTAGEPSYGIGLQLVRDLIREESGTVEVESTEGEGTCFSITLSL